ncbi:hypothetical protein LTR17_021814 [Elasticomyces elasticus]|nr:hypothetical protein LTR17_021814 [Elasticomyces elasticus]
MPEWLLSIVASLSTFAAVVTSTAIFSAFVGSMNEILKPYKVHLSVGTQALALVWFAVLFSWAGTAFWLFSACCCAGRNNPHHRSNKDGLWSSKSSNGRHSGLRALKTGSSYEGVSTNPFMAEDKEPLVTKYERPAMHSREPSSKFEPLRHY